MRSTKKVLARIYSQTINIRYISGIVITEAKLDINVIEAPVSVSPPYAAGYTIVFNPNGDAKAIIARVAIVSSIFNSFIAIIIAAGMTTSRNKDITYTFLLKKSFFRS